MLNHSIAESVFNTPSRKPVGEALVTAFHAVTGEQLTPKMYQTRAAANERACAAVGWSNLPPEMAEDYMTFRSLKNIFQKRRLCYTNNLTSWPLYAKLYDTHVRQQQAPDVTPPRNALLLGCETALSAKAFVSLAREEYGAAVTLIVDNNQNAHFKRNHGTYIDGDALHLPFQSSSIDIVQTNQLIHFLPGKGPTEQEAQIGPLLESAARVLAPGGHLLMRELACRLDFSDKSHSSPLALARFTALRDKLGEGLDAAGFERITIEPARDIRRMDFLFDEKRNLTSYPTFETLATLAIYAQKPHDLAPSPQS